MTDPMVVASASVIIIGSIVTGTVTILNAIAANTKKTIEVSKKTDIVMEQTNSNVSDITKSLHTALERIKVLEEAIIALNTRK